MTLRISLFTITFLLAAVQQITAIDVQTNAINNKTVFGIEFSEETRVFYGKEKTIVSITIQEYITTTFNVVEINIVMQGNALLRIYHSKPIGPRELNEALGLIAKSNGISTRPQLPASVQAAADKAAGVFDTVTSDKVIKEYPIATHSKTIEYRMTTRKELLELFDELQKHWLKRPALFENGQIVDSDGATKKEMKPRSLGGTLFTLSD